MNATQHPTAMDKRLENSVEISTLCAFYGGLLTPRQREAVTLHHDEDLSLGEIAEQFGVSRQNVHELIARSVEKLRGYEAALGAAERMVDMLKDLNTALTQLDKAKAQPMPDNARQAVEQAAALIRGVILKQEEDAHGI